MKVTVRHIYIIFFVCILFSLLFAEESRAKVTGDCEVCHGKYKGMMEPPEKGKPRQLALRNVLCVNCHTNSDGDTLKIFGGATVPVVFNQIAPSKPLAGGNFYYTILNLGERKGHNVDNIAALDKKNEGFPPGYDRKEDPSIIGYNPKKPLACAGSNGCHGDRNIEDPFASVMGAHHAEDNPVDGSTVAKSYRYLKMTDRIKGVIGIEDPLWEHNRSSKQHNEYSPEMNDLCKNCHGDYHGNEKVGKESPWLRHPTGIVLPKKGEYLRYNPLVMPPPDRPEIRVYNPDAPVARSTFAEPQDLGETVKPGNDVVICLSCHVAHAGPYDASLRWDYDNVFAGEDDGKACMICHAGKGE